VIAMGSRKKGKVHLGIRRNPGGGINWMPILLIGGAAFLLMQGGGLGMLGRGTSVLPPGYTYLGSGYYRGPDGQTYYRSPTTGQMSPATAAQVASGQFTQAGQQVVSGVLTTAVPAVTSGIVNIFGGLVKAIGGAFSDTQPSVVEPTVGYSSVSSADVLRESGGEVGYVPAPLPDFWAESSV